jgi:hypothetical protein
MEKRQPEKCHYCSNPAEYSDLASEGEFFFVTGVCKKHMIDYSDPS